MQVGSLAITLAAIVQDTSHSKVSLRYGWDFQLYSMYGNSTIGNKNPTSLSSGPFVYCKYIPYKGLPYKGLKA